MRLNPFIATAQSIQNTKMGITFVVPDRDFMLPSDYLQRWPDESSLPLLLLVRVCRRGGGWGSLIYLPLSTRCTRVLRPMDSYIMSYQWFKFYGGEYLSDPKLLGLDANSRSCWLTLLCYASVSTEPGVIKFLTEAQLMVQSGVLMGGEEWNRTEGILARFVERKMIEINDGIIIISNWEKRQDSNLSDAERSKKYREKNSTVTRPSRDRHVNVTQSSRVRHARIEENRIDKNRIDTYPHAAKAALPPGDAASFASFWGAYPLKKEKKKASTAWIKSIKVATPEQIMNGLERAKKSRQWLKDGGQFIPHPTTWLNGERWNDEDTAPITRKSDKF